MPEICVHDVFLVCNYGILPAWALLIALPASPWTQRIVHSMLVPVVLGAVYVWAFIANPDLPEGGGFTTLGGVMAMFTSPWIALAGWVHYLIFDLFIGAWEVRDAGRRGIRHLYVVPCLIATLLAGPVGLAAYLLLRMLLHGVPMLAEVATSVPDASAVPAPAADS